MEYRTVTHSSADIRAAARKALKGYWKQAALFMASIKCPNIDTILPFCILSSILHSHCLENTVIIVLTP